MYNFALSLNYVYKKMENFSIRLVADDGSVEHSV